ncbi:UBA/TS-N domain-containing protein [Toxoplasma gondii GAB2-2007-GAL-DOM2]|uniref:UBA/TS-N domain-containing protein n=3 Tax=Toxoplasma gondii TaxID=5811 RepID=A0A086LH25_TOXGO|nr:UBA/TS-N domain-containing protein [Toxoplasma gondii GAB2-2007-GAL-DOM2]KFG55943.1 UBA/TS-N domain-containing protein [Toxoplasma gondii FOU]PUA91782.1 UBA/TS-N domain-containing protein [Toxoplasma gondii TgCATBr9]
MTMEGQQDLTVIPPLSHQDADRRWAVQLRVYDISRGIARQMSPLLLGRQIDGIWHTGVVVYGIEYFYGGGVCTLPPEEVERDYQMQPTCVVNMGFTTIDKSTFDAFVEQISPRFTAATYDLLNWNCNHFTTELTQYLLSKPIPDYIRFQVQEVAQTPMGRMILPMLQRQQQDIQRVAAAMGRRTLWTQGESPQAVAASPASETFSPPDISSPLATVLGRVCTNRELARSTKKVFLLTLLTVVSNLLKPERDSKFLRLRRSNQVIQSKVLRIPGGEEALELLGFELLRGGEPLGARPGAAEAPGGDANAEDEFVFTLFRDPTTEANAVEKLNVQKTEIQAFFDALERAGGSTTPSAASSGAGDSDGGRSATAVQSPEEKFKFQLQQLESMGFPDTQKNIEALQAVNGNLNAAIDRLLS